MALAVLFHVTYEKLAPDSGYKTRQETRIFDPESRNGKLYDFDMRGNSKSNSRSRIESMRLSGHAGRALKLQHGHFRNS